MSQLALNQNHTTLFHGNTGSDIVKRMFSLRFHEGVSAEEVAGKINAWNSIFSKFPGNGYIDFHPHYREANYIGRKGSHRIEEFHLYSDKEFWEAFKSNHASISHVVESVVMEGDTVCQVSC